MEPKIDLPFGHEHGDQTGTPQGGPAAVKVNIGNITLNYPFPHQIEPGLLASGEFLGNSTNWHHWLVRFAGHEKQGKDQLGNAIDQSFSLQPHTRRVMYPDLTGKRLLDGEDDKLEGFLKSIEDFLGTKKSAADTFKFIREATLDHVPDPPKYFGKPQGDCLSQHFLGTTTRLTWCNPDIVSAEEKLTLIDEEGNKESQITVEWVDVTFWPDGNGLISISLRPTNCQPIELPDAAWLLRSLGKIQYRRRSGFGTLKFKKLHDQPSAAEEKWRTWADLLQILLGEFRLWQGDINSQASDLDTEWHVAAFAQIDFGDTPESDGTWLPFESELDRYAFALATGYAPQINTDGSKRNSPGPRTWSLISQEGVLDIWDEWRMISYYENLIHVVRKVDSTYPTQQLENFRGEYLSLYMSAIAQSKALELFESEIGMAGGDIESLETDFNGFEERFLRFSTRVFDYDASVTPVGKPLYQMLRSSLKLEEKLSNVGNDQERVQRALVNKLAYRQARISSRNQIFVEVVGSAFFVLALMVSLFSQKLSHVPVVRHLTTPWLWFWSILAALLVGILILVVRVLFARLQIKSEPSDDSF